MRMKVKLFFFSLTDVVQVLQKEGKALKVSIQWTQCSSLESRPCPSLQQLKRISVWKSPWTLNTASARSILLSNDISCFRMKRERERERAFLFVMQHCLNFEWRQRWTHTGILFLFLFQSSLFPMSTYVLYLVWQQTALYCTVQTCSGHPGDLIGAIDMESNCLPMSSISGSSGELLLWCTQCCCCCCDRVGSKWLAPVQDSVPVLMVLMLWQRALSH